LGLSKLPPEYRLFPLTSTVVYEPSFCFFSQYILVGLGVPDTEQNRVAWFPSSTSPGIVIDTANKPSKTNEK
jgi:hypothetical protein